MENDNIMKHETILPPDFSGTFEFTNWSDEEFVGVWGKKEYRFPPQARSPMIMPEHSPLEIQNIRKKFAKDLAEREFFKGQSYETLRSQEGTPNNRTMGGIHQAATYSLDQLTPYIQRALEPLDVVPATVATVQEISLESKLSRNRKGHLNTKAVEDENDLERMAKGE